MTPGQIKYTKKIIPVIMTVLLLLGVFYWFYSHSKITIIVSGAELNEKVSYSLFRQGSLVPISIVTEKNQISRTVTKGEYEILVKSSVKSYMQVINSKGFFGTTIVNAPLHEEYDRQFIGDNPASCTKIINGSLISYTCNDDLTKLRIHLPASSTQSSYVLVNPNKDISGLVEGIIETNEGNIALVQNKNNTAQSLMLLNNNLAMLKNISLTDLNGNNFYSIIAYQKGFLIYDQSFNTILFYASVNAKPYPVNIEKPKTLHLSPYSLTVSDSSIILSYTNNPGDGKGGKNAKTYVSLYHDSKSTQYTFKGQYSTILMCSPNKLCLLNDTVLEVYDLSSQKPFLVNTIGRVNSIVNVASGLLIVRDDGVLHFDIDKKAGFEEYSFGPYRYCGLQPENYGYTLCIVSAQNKRTTLFINETATNTTNIDKKIAELAKEPNISRISIYGKYIFISPKGPIVYNANLKEYGPDPIIQKTINEAINVKIKYLKFDPVLFTVINTSGTY
ncbi:MAG: hypothetical protein NVSMB46_08630 [Candidatus Saccharimonadales bacterium]